MRIARPPPKTVKPARPTPAATRRPVAQPGLGAPPTDHARTLDPQLTATAIASMPLGEGAPLPAWVPAEFQLHKAAQGLRALIESRGETVVPAKTLLVTDADRTLLATNAGTLLRDTSTGELLRNPRTHEVFHLGSDFEAEVVALERMFPLLPWARVELDFSEFADGEAVKHAQLIATTARAIQESEKDPFARQVMVTARNAPQVMAAFESVSRTHSLGLDAVLSSSAPEELAAMGLTGVPLNTAERKALVIAALVELHGASRVSYYDDSDLNLALTKELLTSLFPKTRVEVVDIVEGDDGRFEQVIR